MIRKEPNSQTARTVAKILGQCEYPLERDGAGFLLCIVPGASPGDAGTVNRGVGGMVLPKFPDGSEFDSADFAGVSADSFEFGGYPSFFGEAGEEAVSSCFITPLFLQKEHGTRYNGS